MKLDENNNTVHAPLARYICTMCMNEDHPCIWLIHKKWIVETAKDSQCIGYCPKGLSGADFVLYDK